MNTLRVSTRFAALALLGLPLFAAPSECERAERTRAELHNIRQLAARVQTNTDEFRAYLRNASADWPGLAYSLAYVTEDVKNMQRALGACTPWSRNSHRGSRLSWIISTDP